MIAGVILAAGSSKRLGHSKQLVTLNGQTLIHRSVATALAAGLDPVIVVVNNAELIEPLQALGAHGVLNRRHFEGMATSIHVGVQRAAAVGADGLVIMACDQPALTAAHLLDLTTNPGEIAGSGYAGRIGIPAYFPAAMFASLMELEGDNGARNLLLNARSVVAEDLQLDVDTEDDLSRARELFG